MKWLFALFLMFALSVSIINNSSAMEDEMKSPYQIEYDYGRCWGQNNGAYDGIYRKVFGASRPYIENIARRDGFDVGYREGYEHSNFKLMNIEKQTEEAK